MSQPSHSLLVKEIGEQGLLARLQAFCPIDVVGDDAAVLTVQPERSLVVTSDVLVDGVHFSDRTTSPEDAGWRAAAANLSDLAAMGALPLGITVGLSLPGHVTVAWVEQLYQGLVACLELHDTSIVGGDICRSSVTTIAITAFGQVAPDRVIRRSTAQPGDAILVTGVHGASRAGLELLLHPELGQNLTEQARNLLVKAHQRPQPRLDVLPVLESLGQKDGSNVSSSFSTAGMDSSDGLADAVLQICRASQVGARLERSRIPYPDVFQTWLAPQQAIDWALYGGEDFELVLCMPEQLAKEAVAALGEGAAIVGEITTGNQVLLMDETGQFADEVLSLDRGFQHF
jgi:thiamine-monophosphate kinase